MQPNLKLFYSSFALGLVAWWIGLGGGDLYKLPLLVGFIQMAVWVVRGTFKPNLEIVGNQLLTDASESKTQKYLGLFLILQPII
ncbi:MAG: hypothetical protein QNL04_11840 [SAR324 cluster bacterium]|nr:hypothetical protein [SAR324 cluster bacterium]